MPRKLKFYRPKNYERKKLSFIISIRLQDVTVTSLSAVPNQLVQIPQLILSLPISTYMTAPVTDLHHLCSRLSAQSLPDGWRKHMDGTHSGLILSYLSVNSSTLMPVTSFIVKVDNNLKWSLSYNGMLVKNQQHCGFSILEEIKCLNDVLTVLSSVQVSHVCCGNSVEEFKQLVDDHCGEFKDSEGCYIILSCF